MKLYLSSEVLSCSTHKPALNFLGKSLLIGVDVDADFLSGSAISRLKGLVGGDFLDAEKKSNNRNFRLHGRFNVLITSNTRLRIKLQGDQSAWRR